MVIILFHKGVLNNSVNKEIVFLNLVGRYGVERGWLVG